MKKIIATIMALLTIGGSQASALSKNTIKKAVSSVSTKILPAAAVTLGVGVLAKKFMQTHNNSNSESVKACDDNNHESVKACNKTNPEREAYEDGIRYIKWHSSMCWFNASILNLYYDDYYRDYLYNLKEDTYKEDDKVCKKVTIELSRLIKKIKNSPTCMCELTKEDYNRVLSSYDDPNYRFARCGGDISTLFINSIKYYDLQRSPSRNQIASRTVSSVYRNGHYYNLYYSKKSNRLYSIGRIVYEGFGNSVEVISSETDKNNWLDQIKSNRVIYIVK